MNEMFLFAPKSLLHDFASTMKTTSVVLGTSSPDISKISPSATYDPFIKLQLEIGKYKIIDDRTYDRNYVAQIRDSL